MKNQEGGIIPPSLFRVKEPLGGHPNPFLQEGLKQERISKNMVIFLALRYFTLHKILIF